MKRYQFLALMEMLHLIAMILLHSADLDELASRDFEQRISIVRYEATNGQDENPSTR